MSCWLIHLPHFITKLKIHQIPIIYLSISFLFPCNFNHFGIHIFCSTYFLALFALTLWPMSFLWLVVRKYEKLCEVYIWDCALWLLKLNHWPHPNQDKIKISKCICSSQRDFHKYICITITYNRWHLVRVSYEKFITGQTQTKTAIHISTDKVSAIHYTIFNCKLSRHQIT